MPSLMQGSDRWGKNLALLWGHLNICPSLQQFHISSITQSETLLPHQPQGLGGTKENSAMTSPSSWCLLKEEATGDRKYGLSTIWVNPC